MAALPIYVAVPNFYAGTLGLDLTRVGLLLLLVRALDALQDPWLGYLSDNSRHAPRGRWRWVIWGAPLLALGMVAVFRPPPLAPGWLTAWLGVALVLVYLGYSLMSISYQALGAELSTDLNERTRITAWREALGLCGVLLAAALPQWWTLSVGSQVAYARFSLVFVPLLLGLGWLSVRYSPRVARPPPPPQAPTPLLRALFAPRHNPAFRALAGVFVVNGIAAAIPATMVLFFVADVLQLPAWGGAFLLAYFAAGACGMPLWLRAARTYGKARAWGAGMLMSIVAFVFTFTLGPGDSGLFLAICLLSGLALGADLAIPPSLLADVIDREDALHEVAGAGAYFGLWNLLTKANLALAAGLGLPLLAAFGYEAGSRTPEGLFALSAVYALVPCALKAVAALLLQRAHRLHTPPPTRLAGVPNRP